MSFDKISFEISIKPFCNDLSDEGFRSVARKIFHQWENLFKGKRLQFMFWTADGSELLDYSGNPDDAFEYAKFIGYANECTNEYAKVPEIELQTIHQRPYVFMENPPVWTYKDLQRLIRILKDVYHQDYGGILEIGTTFDPGPEFAISHFKYERHPETLGNMLGYKVFIFCYSTLNADTFHYAAYPEGIPQGEHFGTFIGKQAQCFMTDMGFDFIWFSNGLGFGVETWGNTGAVFDGKKFFPENSHRTSDLVFQFWNDFRKECPKFRIENRGTNLTTGIDLASDAVPLREIYNNINDIEAPPNSPWAAINHNFGLELAGWMSHIAELPPGKGFPFRFYTHDPWWLNSPWLDRYDRMPHDIYLPMAISRLNANGKPETATQLNLLSIDDSYGNLPDQVPQEVIPHLIDAQRTEPDQAGPLVWVYPFDEYHDAVYNGRQLEEVFFGDNQIITALNNGFPLNTVVSTRNFLQAPARTFAGRILVVPTLISDDVFDKLLKLRASDAKILLYGPAHSQKIRDFLQLETAEPLEGICAIPGYGHVMHHAIFSGGPLDDVLKSSASNVKILSEYVFGEKRRPAVVKYDNDFIWIRGTNSFQNVNYDVTFMGGDFFWPEFFYRSVLAHFGLDIDFERPEKHVPSPRLGIRIHDNAFYFSIFGTNTTVRQFISMPDGAPLFRGRDMVLQNNRGLYSTEKWSNLEARLFVRGDDTVIECTEWTCENRGMNRRMLVQGLKNATIVFRPTEQNSETVVFRIQAHPYENHTLFTTSNVVVEETKDAFGKKYIARGLNGILSVFWGTKPDPSKW